MFVKLARPAIPAAVTANAKKVRCPHGLSIYSITRLALTLPNIKAKSLFSNQKVRLRRVDVTLDKQPRSQTRDYVCVEFCVEQKLTSAISCELHPGCDGIFCTRRTCTTSTCGVLLRRHTNNSDAPLSELMGQPSEAANCVQNVFKHGHDWLKALS